jgi:hypothetical protein
MNLLFEIILTKKVRKQIEKLANLARMLTFPHLAVLHLVLFLELASYLPHELSLIAERPQFPLQEITHFLPLRPVINNVESVGELLNGITQDYNIVYCWFNPSLLEEMVLEIQNFVIFIHFSLRFLPGDGQHHTLEEVVLIVV